MNHEQILRKGEMLMASFITFFLLFISCGTSKSLHHQPELVGYQDAVPILKKQSDTIFYSGKNFLIKNKQQLWELYVAGDPLERGLLIGSLTDSLYKKQETIFFARIEDMVQSKFKQNILRNFLKWYNRKLYVHVPEEYKTEIYGISQYASEEFNYIAPPYLRSLYLHGAHDIGHAVQDLALVGCSSFAAWGKKSEDGHLILGRNFDFYVGDYFAKDKLVTFMCPEKGYPFMMVTWPGMVGAVSGMNIEGLTVTINAAKSKTPWIAKTPIAILTREILQYAKNEEEAIAIAKKRKVFVSESIMIGSAHDKKAFLIEVSPDTLGIYDVMNTNELFCSNHFQSDVLKDETRNQDQIINSHSQYRYERMVTLFSENPKINPQIAAAILRNKEGLYNIPLGYGNEKALNQLLAHHAIIFKPEQRLVWVSSNPYQLGEFVCYDLKAIFNGQRPEESIVSLAQHDLNIPKDSFLETKEYKNYELFRVEDKKINKFLKNKKNIREDNIAYYQSLNPEYWVVYYKVGLYFYRSKDYQRAQEQFQKALAKEVTTLLDKQEIERYIKKMKNKIK